MLRVTELTKTCEACPAQWEGRTNDGRTVYVRYRWGYLSVRVSEQPTDNVDDAVRGEEIFGRQLGDEYDGEILYHQVQRQTAGVVEWP